MAGMMQESDRNTNAKTLFVNDERPVGLLLDILIRQIVFG